MGADEIPRASMRAVCAGDREGWLALFEEDARLEDPVGGYPEWDPEGKGFHGKAEIARFYDEVIAPSKPLSFDIQHAVKCGNEVAAYAMMEIASLGKCAVIVIYILSSAGRIAGLRAFWS